MKKIALGFMAIAALIITSCTNPMDKPLNSEDFGKIKEEISADKNYSQMKKNYIIDNLTQQLGFLELGKTMGKAMGKDMDESKISTFKEEIVELTVAFDSIRTAKIEIAENNNKLENFIELIDANTISMDKYKGYLSMTLKFNNQFEKEMSLRGYALPPYKTYKKTTDSRGKFYLFDNLIQGQEINNENQVIVGDITYYENQGELYYIFQFTDLFTKEIKGLIGSKTMEGINAEKCLREVFKYNSRNKYNNSLIVHTDAGGQYRSYKYQDMLRKAQIRPSQAKSCFENGLAERINGIVKNEYLIDYDIKSLSHLNKVLKKIKKSVNEVWPSKALGYKTPRQYAETVRQLKAKDRPKKVVKIIE